MPTRRRRARQVPSRRAPRPSTVALVVLLLVGLAAPAAAATGPGSGPGTSARGSSTATTTTTTVPGGSRATPAVAASPTEQAQASAASLRRDREAIRAQVTSLRRQRAEQYDRWALNQLALQAAQQEVTSSRQRAEQARLEALSAKDQLTAYAAEAFMSPPASESLAVLSIADADTASRAHDLLSIVADEQHGVVGEFLVAEQTEQRRAQQAEVEVVEHSSREAVHAAELTRLDALITQQQQLDAQIDERLDSALAEVAALEEVDRKAAGQLAEQERALADESKAATTANTAVTGNTGARGTDQSPKPAAPPKGGSGAPPTTKAPPTPATTTTTTVPTSPVAPSSPPGNLVTWQDVTKVGGIWVHRSIAARVEALLAAAASSGIRLSGGGFRDPSEQIRLRRAHCGPTDYDVYQKPASQCTPPTAQPGRSMHERGLAIDFTVGGRAISSRSDPAFQWLAANAATYGLYNLPSEPWHWSTNGS